MQFQLVGGQTLRINKWFDNLSVTSKQKTLKLNQRSINDCQFITNVSSQHSTALEVLLINN